MDYCADKTLWRNDNDRYEVILGYGFAALAAKLVAR
jgi:hypothetical protein